MAYFRSYQTYHGYIVILMIRHSLPGNTGCELCLCYTGRRKKAGRSEQSRDCYEEVKKATARLKDPVPAGTSKEQYFTEQFYQAAQDPFVYASMQFFQFIEIYQNQDLHDFDTFLKEYLKNSPRQE